MLATCSLTLLFLPGSLAPGALPDPVHELRHAPAPGTARAIEVELGLELAGGELEVVMNGQPVPGTYLPELELAYEDERRLVVRELHGEQGELWRRLDQVTHLHTGDFLMEMPGADPVEHAWDEGGQSELEGALLRLVRGEDGLELAEVAKGPEPPEAMRHDLSFAALLPGGPVEIGDRWEVEEEQLDTLLDPCGELGVELPEDTRRELRLDHDERSVGGRLTVTLVSVEEGVAVLELEGELERVTVAPGDLTPVPVVDGDATDTTTERLILEGTCRWDLAAGALLELELDGACELSTRTLRDPDQPGPSYESTFGQDGSWSLSVRATALEGEEAETLEASAGR